MPRRPLNSEIATLVPTHAVRAGSMGLRLVGGWTRRPPGCTSVLLAHARSATAGSRACFGSTASARRPG